MALKKFKPTSPGRRFMTVSGFDEVTRSKPEKSYSLIEDRKYSFRVHKDAHKTQVRQAVEELFGVKVVAVNMIKVPSKPKMRNYRKGTRPGWKKAIVQLAPGERIELFEGAETA